MRIYYSGMGLVYQLPAAPEGVLSSASVMLSYEFIRLTRKGRKLTGQAARFRWMLRGQKDRKPK